MYNRSLNKPHQVQNQNNNHQTLEVLQIVLGKSRTQSSVYDDPYLLQAIPDQLEISMKNLSTIKLENPLLAIQGFKIQQEIKDMPRRVTQFHFCRSQPKVRKNPQLFGISKRTMDLLGLNYEDVKNDPQTPVYLSGSKLIPNSQVLAHNYCGHQFGVWAGQLGDGRAHILGSIKNGEKLYQLQLKGSGLTPFSRHADGNSVVSSALRQFLASQLMAGLGVPTTRAGSLIIADDQVVRDPFYDGRIKVEKAAIVLRVCQTFIRFGSLEVCRPNGQMRKPLPQQNRLLIQPLCDYAISQHFPDIDIHQTDPYEQLYKRLVKKSAQLVAYWQSIGFVHGVLNTDNMSLGGVTIDYGPFAFIDYFSKDFVSNASDQHQRYSFRRQPKVVFWNLQRLAEAMDHLVPYSTLKEYLTQNFDKFFNEKYYTLMSQKLGLQNKEQNKKLIDQLIDNMHVCGTHFTNLFRIIEQNSQNPKNKEELTDLILSQSEPTEFYFKNLRVFPQLFQAKVEKILEEDDGYNPYFIAEQKERYKIRQSLSDCKTRAQSQKKLWSQWVKNYLEQRNHSQDKKINNPKYTLLNFIAKQIQQEIINMSAEESEKHLSKILEVFAKPYQKNEWFQQTYWKKAPVPVKLTCSS